MNYTLKPSNKDRSAIARANKGKVTDQYVRRKRTELGVEDAAKAGLREVLNPDKARFTAGGRGDVDVRMLRTHAWGGAFNLSRKGKFCIHILGVILD